MDAAVTATTTPGDTAPCTRRGCSPDAMEVRGVSRAEVDWGAVTPPEWAAIERAGLTRRISRQLRAGVLGDSASEALTPAQAAARAILAVLPEGTVAHRLRAATYLVREQIYDDALRQAGGSRAGAAELLGVPTSRVAEALRASHWLAAAHPAGPRGPTGAEPTE